MADEPQELGMFSEMYYSIKPKIVRTIQNYAFTMTGIGAGAYTSAEHYKISGAIVGGLLGLCGDLLFKIPHLFKDTHNKRKEHLEKKINLGQQGNNQNSPQPQGNNQNYLPPLPPNEIEKLQKQIKKETEAIESLETLITAIDSAQLFIKVPISAAILSKYLF